MDLKINIDYTNRKADVSINMSEAETENMSRVAMRAMDMQETLGPQVLEWLSPIFNRAFSLLEKKIERQCHRKRH